MLFPIAICAIFYKKNFDCQNFGGVVTPPTTTGLFFIGQKIEIDRNMTNFLEILNLKHHMFVLFRTVVYSNLHLKVVPAQMRTFYDSFAFFYIYLITPIGWYWRNIVKNIKNGDMNN